MKNLSVAMVIQNFYPSIGGAERQALALSREFVRKGLRVTVVTQKKPGQRALDSMDGIVIHRLGSSPLSFLALSFFWLLRNAGTLDVIHAHMASSHAVGAALAGRLTGKKVVVKLSGSKVVGEIAVSRRSILGRLKLRALGFFKPHLVLVSQAQRDELTDFGLEKLPTHFIPNGVNTEKFFPSKPEQKNRIRKRLGWDGVICLFVGRFSSDKLREDVFANVLNAWAHVSKAGQPISFYLIGDGELRDIYNGLIQKQGLQRTVHLWSSREDVADLYQAADIFILPSTTEGLSNALLEAMASGLPVAGSRVPGIAEIVKNGRHGFLFNPDEPSDIAKALEQMVADEKQRSEMGRACVETARAYSIDQTTDRTLRLYQEAA